MAITSISELLNLFPANVVQYQGNEYKAPCPFCDSGSKHSIVRNGHEVSFYGEDRLLIDDKGLYCRRCDSSSRGYGRGTRGWYPYNAVAELFELEISSSLDMTDNFEETPLETWTLEQVVEANTNVQPEYWKQFYWDDSVIHKLRLGYGKFDFYSSPGHVVPMRVHHVLDDTIADGYYMHLRAENGQKIRLRGSSRNYIWRLNWDLDVNTVTIVEGEKDGITAMMLGFKNIIPLFGGRTWNDDKTRYLLKHNYLTAFSILDADDPGREDSERLIGSVRRLGVTSVSLNWEDVPEGVTDLTELFVHFEGDVEKTRLYIKKHWFKQDPLLSNPLLDRDDSTPLTIDDIRGDGPDSLQYNISNFIQTYELETSRRVGAGLMLHVGPGAGKTFTLVREAERIARESIRIGEEEYKGLISQIEVEKTKLDPSGDPIEQTLLKERIVDLQEEVDAFSFRSVAWFGMYKDGWKDILQTGADPALWYNYEARTSDNCKNMDMVNKLGKNNHNIGRFCKTGCPFRDTCKKSGYLHQEKKSIKKPITFFRHQHLHGSFGAEYRDLVVVDEYPGGILDSTPVVFKPKDVRSHHNDSDLLDYEDETQWEHLNKLTSALLAVMTDNDSVPYKVDGEDNPDWRVSGAAFLRRVDNHLMSVSKLTLPMVMEILDRNVVHNIYQPTMSTGDISRVQLRCVPQLYDAIQRELPRYVADIMNESPSCIHLEGGKLEVYDAHKIAVRNTTPVIVADATGIPDVYQAMFGRKFQKYNPRFMNPQAITIVINKNDYSKTYIGFQVGAHMTARQGKSKKAVVNDKGEEIEIPITVEDAWKDIYDSKLIQELIGLVKYLSDKHPNLLVVTHKNLRELLSSIADGIHSDFKFTNRRTRKVEWAHYGSLRGSNQYEDYEAVLLIGAFRIPYSSLWKKIQMWAWLLGLVEPIPFELVAKRLHYDQTSTTGKYLTFDHSFADQFVNMVERGEMIQSAERIRPHSTKIKKVIYVVAERPALTFVSQVITKKEFFRQFISDSHTEAKDFMLRYKVENGVYPAYSMVEKRFKISSKTIRKLREKIDVETA